MDYPSCGIGLDKCPSDSWDYGTKFLGYFCFYGFCSLLSVCISLKEIDWHLHNLNTAKNGGDTAAAI